MADAVLEFLGRIFYYFVSEILIGKIFYWPGWLMLRILSMGRYPPKQSEPHNREAVACFALVNVIAIVCTMLYMGAS